MMIGSIVDVASNRPLIPMVSRLLLDFRYRTEPTVLPESRLRHRARGPYMQKNRTNLYALGMIP